MSEDRVDENLSSRLWQRLTDHAHELVEKAPTIATAIKSQILDRSSFGDALVHVLASSMREAVPADVDLIPLFIKYLRLSPEIAEDAAADLQKLDSINPACLDVLAGFMSFRGFLGLQLYRFTHAMWTSGEKQIAVLLQNWGAMKYAMDIHPAATIGRSVFIDHGIGLVIGSTSVVEDGVNIWHGVTLGATLTQAGDRHPKIRRNATLCAGATILGNIEVGAGSIVAASSVVLKSVPADSIVAGIPAKIIGKAPESLGAIDQSQKSTSTKAQEKVNA